MAEEGKTIRPPSYLDALIPIILLIILLASAVFPRADGTAGPIQVALMLSMMVAGLVGLKNGHKWEDMGKAAFYDIGDDRVEDTEHELAVTG